MSGDSKNILIVEDELDITQAIIRKILYAKKEYIPLVAHDGYEAIDLLRKYDVSAVVLDIKMRNLDGMTVCQEMHKDKRMKSIPVIVSSGGINHEERNRLAHLGIKHFLDKPYPMDSLLGLLEDVVQD